MGACDVVQDQLEHPHRAVRAVGPALPRQPLVSRPHGFVVHLVGGRLAKT